MIVHIIPHVFTISKNRVCYLQRISVGIDVGNSFVVWIRGAVPAYRLMFVSSSPPDCYIVTKSPI